MLESLIQWTLLRRPEYLADRLGVNLERKIAENYTTDQGRIDFAFETDNAVLVVELETAVDTKAKCDYCTDQVRRYMDIPFSTEKPVRFVILFDEKGTPHRFAQRLRDFASQMQVMLRTYSALKVQELYTECLKKLERTSGLYLGPPVAMDVTHLRWLNRVVEPFWKAQTDALTRHEIRSLFGSRTSFGVYTTLAKNFELVTDPKASNIQLTDYGKRFRDNYNAQIIRSRATMPDLSTEQKRVLLESLVNGNFTKSKVNLYYFLRFVHLSDGSWLPRKATPEDRSKALFINFLFGSNYKWSTITELLAYSSNQCEELGLIEKVKLEKGHYDRAIMTSLGSRILGYLELYLHLRREQVQIPFQV